jgi:hypothetical protein
MIQRFVNAFMAAKPDIEAGLAKTYPIDYDDLVNRVLAVCATAKGQSGYDDVPDVERITVIDHGEYQGTRLYIVAAEGYQPSTYWSIFVNYGSCSGCDTFEAIKDYNYDAPTPEQIGEYWTLMLHMVQSMREIGKDEE